jgi:hypothetical protein
MCLHFFMIAMPLDIILEEREINAHDEAFMQVFR